MISNHYIQIDAILFTDYKQMSTEKYKQYFLTKINNIIINNILRTNSTKTCNTLLFKGKIKYNILFG